MRKSRSKNAILNISTSYIAQIGILLLSFVGRRIFINYLSIDYLGIQGLYTNLLSLLAFAELGIGNVALFSFYKPVAEGKTAQVNLLLQYFKKLYLIVASVVLILGLLFIPFLKYIINSNLKEDALVTYYVLFLLNSVVSYLSAHNIALIAAHQDNRIEKIVALGTNLLSQSLHIIILIIWQNYTYYISATLVTTLINVLAINIICGKRYPYAQIKKTELSKNIELSKDGILRNLKAIFMYKIGAIIINNTDNILISVLVNTVSVGMYSNYYMVVGTIQGFISIITTSIVSGVGNLSAEGNKARMLRVFCAMLLIYHFIAVLGGVSFYFLFNDFIPIWLGKRYIMSQPIVFAIAFNFYLTNAISPIWMYREANGLFDKVKYLLLITALVNIILSIIGGKLWGVFGILVATLISRIITQVWYEPHILFNFVFQESQKVYWKLQLKYVCSAVIASGLCYLVTLIMPHAFIFLIIKAFLFLLICIAIFFISNFKSKEFIEIKNVMKNMFVKFI